MTEEERQAAIDRVIKGKKTSLSNYIRLYQINNILGSLIEDKRKEYELANEEVKANNRKMKDLLREIEEVAEPLTEEEEPGLEQAILEVLKENNTDLERFTKVMLESLTPMEKLEFGEIIGKYLLKETKKNNLTESTKLNEVKNDIGLLVEQIKNVQSPKTTTVLTDKSTRTLASGQINYRERTPLKMEQGTVKNIEDQITTFITLDYESIEDVLPENIDGDDINLTEAIISLGEANVELGVNIFTFNQIYRVLKRNSKASPNKKSRDLLEEKLEKQMRTLYELDATQEQRYYPNLNIKRKTNFLKGEIITVDYYGNKVKAFKLDEMPLIYKHAKAKKQLTKIPFELTNNNLIKTDSVLKLEKYILRSIAQMKSRRYLNRSMKFETIYKNMNFKQRSKSAIDNAKSRTIRNTEDILKGLVETNYIKGFDFNLKEKGKYYSVTIDL